MWKLISRSLDEEKNRQLQPHTLLRCIYPKASMPRLTRSVPFSPVAMATGTAEVIVTVGGEDDKVVLRSVESFDPLTNQWKNLACLPFAVSKHGLVASGEETPD